MFNLVYQWPIFSKNISIFQGKILWKVVELATKLYSVTATITVIFIITTKRTSNLALQDNSSVCVWWKSEVVKRGTDVFVCQPWNVTYVNIKEQVQWEKTASKRTISCEKGHLQIFYSDDMRKPISNGPIRYRKQDVTHYIYFVKNVNKTAVNMLLTFKDNMHLDKLLAQNSEIRFTGFAYFTSCILNIL
jgi:hypothetical protein